VYRLIRASHHQHPSLPLPGEDASSLISILRGDTLPFHRDICQDCLAGYFGNSRDAAARGGHRSTPLYDGNGRDGCRERTGRTNRPDEMEQQTTAGAIITAAGCGHRTLWSPCTARGRGIHYVVGPRRAESGVVWGVLQVRFSAVFTARRKIP